MHKMQNDVNPQFQCFQKPIKDKEQSKQSIKTFNLKEGWKLKSPDTFFWEKKSPNKGSETIFSYLIAKVKFIDYLLPGVELFIDLNRPSLGELLYYLFISELWIDCLGALNKVILVDPKSK